MMDTEARFYHPDELSKQEVEAFRDVIYRYSDEHGRSFPWRETTDPYSILVSEVMLQQTQTSRAVPKYHLFIKRFPHVQALAAASLRNVLEIWQGLGYNRRAQHLRQAAADIMDRFDGVIPSDEEALRSLPGIGPYTAAAIRAFAFDLPAVVMDTNVRTVFIHFFFPHRDEVSDGDIRPLVEATLDRSSPRRWYSALMDYGAMLKHRHDNPGRKSRSYSRQPAFEASDWQIRGAIIRLLLDGSMTRQELMGAIDAGESRVAAIIDRLCREHLVEAKGDGLSIARKR